MINYIVDRLEERINTSDKTLLFLGGPAMKCMATFQNIDISQEEDHARNILLHVFAVDINNHASFQVVVVISLHAVNDLIKVSLSILGICTTQGGACVTTLCDQGVGAVADVQENKGLPAVQRLSKHLPKISYAVLWYLLRSLPVMFQHFSFNPKTTLKSLLCVIPSMLSRQQPTFKIPTLEENQKISVIHCLMKNCLWVRRDDTTVFWTEHPQVFPSSFGASLNFNISEESAIHLDNSLEPHMKLTQKQQPAKTWLFQHVLGKSHNEMASAVALRTSQQKPLFGSLLQDVCENDELPQAILEMLFMIDQKGPATKTIFSQCANWEDCQALKEKLNSREQVNWETTCPILVATVLKDLLQNIPGSILTANLYEDFIGVLEEGNEEAKIAIIKRLFQQLPKPNVCLLQSIFCCIHKISQTSPSKEMTSSNLVWCITPSLLWPSVASISDKGTEWKRKVALVQFVLDHCFRIFGNHLTATNQENAKRGDNYRGVSETCNNLKTVQMKFSEQTSTSNNSPSGSHLRPAQKQHSLKKWLFQRVLSRNHKLTPATALHTYPQTPLFGSFLQDVCENDKLPQPLLNMLSIIDQKGPVTNAIFSKCASWEDCLALKEKLNSGEHVDWETTCPVLVATVLKDLLQNIPGSVLTANLYEKFIDILDEGNEEAKIAMILRLLQQLPKPNVHLLQSLFRCLCKISQNSPSKEMTSSNLAWCITPSLLQPPIASILDKGTEWKKKVAFVQFLLDHCFKIFGDDFTPTIRDNVTHMDHNLEASEACSHPENVGMGFHELNTTSNHLTSSSHSHLKPARKKHSIKKWLAQRVFGNKHNKVAPTPTLPTSKQAPLFGSPLRDICPKGQLPKSISDMFSCIDSKGQYTEGIFKTRVNGQAYRALKEKLNSREHVDWTSESPYVVATVLKDFLQSIPGSLFTTSLYEEFIDALDEGNNEARTATICRLLDQLPKLNFHLLESLFLCLHKIAYSPLSKMTSFDLALCLTPSLLWLPISGSSGRGMEWQRKVTLVQYLIENYTRIFGHKLSSPMGEDIENQDNVQDTSEKMEQSVDFERVDITLID